MQTVLYLFDLMALTWVLRAGLISLIKNLRNKAILVRTMDKNNDIVRKLQSEKRITEGQGGKCPIYKNG